jgi:elongation factor G
MGKVCPENVRAIAVVGHAATGKTTLVEAMLFAAGATPRMGRVEDGTTQTDYDPEEIRRKMSINATPVTFPWRENELDLVDCPGFIDFLPQSHAAMAAMDACLFCLSQSVNAEPQTEKLFEFAKDLSKPVLVCVTRLDREGTDFSRILTSLKAEIPGHFVPILLPIGAAGSLSGVVNVWTRRAYGANGKECPIPQEMESQIAAYREQLLETAAETDDALTEKYLAGEEISDLELKRALKTAILAGSLIPVAACSASHAIGVQALLDCLCEDLPTPVDHGVGVERPDHSAVTLRPAEDGDCVATVFKVLHEQHVGDIALVRVLSGKLVHGSMVENSTRGEKEKVGQILRVTGKTRTEVQELTVGQVGALVKLRNTRTGDTLCAEKLHVTVPKVADPPPTVCCAAHPSTPADQEKLANVLSKLSTEDPSVLAYTDSTTHEIIFAAMGDVALEIFTNRLRDRYHIHVDMTKPRIPYLETVRGRAEAEGKVKKQTGGHGQFAVVDLRVEPNTGKGFEFVDAIVGGVVPRNFIPAVEKGLKEALAHGVAAGYPVTDVKVTLFFGKYHDVDSSEQAFKTAASIGFKEAARHAHPVLLEPIMNVGITCPDDHLGDIIGDLNSRRGKIQGMDPMGHKTVVHALVPLSEMYRYITNLRSLTGGRGEFTMTHDHYEELPAHLAAPIAAQASRAGAHEA